MCMCWYVNVFILFMCAVYRFLLLWKFVCSFILPLFRLIFSGICCCCCYCHCWILHHQNSVERRRLLVRHSTMFYCAYTRLCITNMLNNRALLYTYRDTRVVVLLIIFHYFSSCILCAFVCVCVCVVAVVFFISYLFSVRQLLPLFPLYCILTTVRVSVLYRDI